MVKKGSSKQSMPMVPMMPMGKNMPMAKKDMPMQPKKSSKKK